MISASTWTLLLLAAGLQNVLGSDSSVAGETEQQESDRQKQQEQLQIFTNTDPLFLTPYIDNCTYQEGRDKSKVKMFEDINVNAHSGYITVDKASNSNLFFVLTEAEGNSPSAPLLLWTQGGPGLSALFGLFLENGPLTFLYENNTPILIPRMKTLQKNMSVIYLDLPLGAGFSFTKDPNAYPHSLNDVAVTVFEFMRQFLLLFPNYRGRDFYLAGESYGARYSVAVAHLMLLHPNNLSVNLKGVIGGNGFLGPILETADSSDFLYQVSMLTEEGRQNFSQRFLLMKTLLNASQYNETLGLLFKTIFADFTRASTTLFQDLTLYNDHASPFYTERPLRLLACFQFINQSSYLRSQIHAGTTTDFYYNNMYLIRSFLFDWLFDITFFIEHVLNNTKVLFYTGQVDALFPSVKQRAYYAALNWKHADKYRNAERKTWKPYLTYHGSAGYIKQAVDFTEAVILGMSHYGAIDKADEVYYLINEFVAKQQPSQPISSAAEI